ncbi:hypothetical protein N431DRAFT_465535 [Stipitochalara longipes BDJ]|nr:hypothetical protein N431DRAFT_465535 [Stipitochalara longipes BDJ]
MAPLPPSRVVSGLYPPSSTSAATHQYLNDRSLTFASEWHFKPEGVKLVKDRFEEELRKRRLEAIHGWMEEDQTFRIRCHPGDAPRIWPLFYVVVSKIINDETGGDDDNSSHVSWTAGYVEDPFESDLIEGLEDYLKRTGQDDTVGGTQQELSEADFKVCDRFPEEIMSFTSKTTWPQIEDPSIVPNLVLDEFASNKNIKELEVLTGCRLIKALNARKIYIGGQSEKNCALAIGKLDILHKYQSMTACQKHIFYGEGEEDFKLIIKPIVDVKMHYFKTTLLEYLLIDFKCNYLTLPTASTVRIAPYDRAKYLYASVNKVNVTPAVKPEDKDRGLTEWKDFKYCGRGQPPEFLQEDATLTQAEVSASMENAPGPSNSARAQAIVSRENKDALIVRWAENVPPVVPLARAVQRLGPSVSMSNSVSTNGNKSRPSWDNYSAFESTPLLRHEFKPRQVSNGLVQSLSQMATSAQGVEIQSSRTPQPMVPQQYAPSQTANISANGPSTNPSHPPRQPLSTISDVQQYAPSQKSRLPTSEAPTVPIQQPRQPMSTISTAQPATDRVPAPSSAASTRTASTASAAERLDLPQSEHRLADNPRVENQASVNKSDVLDSFVYKEPERSLLDDDISLLNFTDPIMQPMQLGHQATAIPDNSRPELESRQPLSEVETRMFHNTMNQRAPKPKPKSTPYTGRLPGLDPVKSTPGTTKDISVVDPLPEFCQELEGSFQDMMKPAQGFRGQVQVQAEFGRVLLNSIHPKHVTSKGSSDNAKTSESLQKLLDSADFTSFTNVLTTTPGEMPYLLNLTGDDGKDLWEKKSPVWNVEYEFFFIDNFADKQNSRFRVVIDAETFGIQIKRHCPLGSIYVHGTCRHWDFRVTVTGIERDRALEEEFGELATAVESSLHVPPDSTTPHLFFKLDEPISKRFELAAIRVYRTCRYKSKDANSMLKISEVYSPDIHKTSVPKECSTHFKLLPGPPERKPCEKPGLGHWFEVSISSAQLDSVLEQNQTLELGEEAKWTPEGLSKLGFAKSIYLRACEMLKQMDGIGQYNNNGVDIKAPQPAKESKVALNPEDDYW